MKYIDYYNVLGVSRAATDKEIKQAYRKLAREHHPDLHQGDAKKTAEENFKLINEAYEVLSDPDKRAKYDQLGMNWQAGQDFVPPDTDGFTFRTVNLDDWNGYGFSDFFTSIFGRDISGQRNRYQTSSSFKGEDVDAEIALTIEELLNGAEKELYLSLPNVCDACGGQRFTSVGVCRTCRGLGTTEERKTVKVKIPAGMYPGSALRLRELGGKGFGSGLPGDLYLYIKAAPHPVWQVINQADLEGELTIYPEQAVLGDKVAVLTPHVTVQLRIQPGTSSGQKLRLKGKGLPTKEGVYGDLYLKVLIAIPRGQSQTEIDLYRQIRALRG